MVVTEASNSYTSMREDNAKRLHLIQGTNAGYHFLLVCFLSHNMRTVQMHASAEQIRK